MRLGFWFALFALAPSIAQAQSIISIDSFSYNGSGCAAGSVSYDLSSDHLALTLLFSDFEVATDAIVSKACAVDLALKIPSGWQFALFSLDTRGYADVELGARGQHSATYRLAGGPPIGLARDQLSGPYNNNYFSHDQINIHANNWTPCTAVDQNLEIDLQMAVAGSASAQAMMTIDSVDGSLSHQFGIRWRHCLSTDANRRFIENLYSDVLGRWASDAEIDGWYTQAARGTNRATIARGFITSQERRTQEVAATYISMLGRQGAPAEITGWVNAINAQKLTSDQLLTAFATSPEFYSRFGGTPQGFVGGLYQTILGRAGAPSEIAGWVPLAARNRTQAVQGILTSPESRDRMVASWYARYLGRPGSQAEWTSWAQGMHAADAQETVQSNIIGSAEYVSRSH